MRLANDSPYGLGSSVFTRDTERGEQIARRLQTGAANVNDAMINYTALELPMGGAKASGLGSRHGAGGIRKYCAQQAIVVTPRLALKREVHMYPYKSRTSRLLAGVCQVPVRPRQARLTQGLSQRSPVPAARYRADARAAGWSFRRSCDGSWPCRAARRA